MLASDLHIHTLMSGHGFNTLKECVEEASKKSLSLIAITDHGPSMERSPHEGYFEMSSRIPKNIDGIGVLFGCEANIIDREGNIDISDSLMRNLDIVIAGLHKRTPYKGFTIKHNTEAVLNAICNHPYINIISHPYRPDFPVDIIDVVYAAIEHNVLLEINVSLLLHEMKVNRNSDTILKTKKMVQLLHDNNIGYIIGSDAHYASEIGIDENVLDMLSQTIGISRQFILNDQIKILSNYIPSIKKTEVI